MKNCIALSLIFFFTITSYAAKVDTLDIPSAAMGKTYKAAVALPDSYAKGKTSYPVLGIFGIGSKTRPIRIL